MYVLKNPDGHGESVQLYRRHNGIFYWQDNDSNKQGTLRATDKREAERLLNAMNESHGQPTINLNLARA